MAADVHGTIRAEANGCAISNKHHDSAPGNKSGCAGAYARFSDPDCCELAALDPRLASVRRGQGRAFGDLVSREVAMRGGRPIHDRSSAAGQYASLSNNTARAVANKIHMSSQNDQLST